ncbi:hypothetical protein VFPPC_15632 [Pochonia chlamydosporia 170]|uniref:Uncharacterized protein n=1 Tax=Pochonia chlamydosporia 170 TaxID=1380566 RepID=A0A179FZ35_METCM|nr:hypothetical protein VFPPC_15632 [Pochonia chlamydosporia 170]OAQ70936.1 hypothetical protein VFPPC_15632 [Pochonia chlamydosporia 170]
MCRRAPDTACKPMSLPAQDKECDARRRNSVRRKWFARMRETNIKQTEVIGRQSSVVVTLKLLLRETSARYTGIREYTML